MAGNADFLSSYFGNVGGPVRGPDNVDVAKYILLNADTRTSGQIERERNPQPSLMSRIFDILSRPNYAIAETVRTGSPMGILTGLSGKKKTTFSDVLKEYGVENNAVAGAGGLLLDIFADPLTYVPGGAIAKGAKTGIRAISGAKDAEKALEIVGTAKDVRRTLPQRLLSQGEPIIPENFGLEAAQKAEIPDIFKAKAPIELPRDILTPVEKAPRVLNKAEDVVPGQLELPLENVPRNLPQKSPQSAGETLANSPEGVRIMLQNMRSYMDLGSPPPGDTRSLAAMAVDAQDALEQAAQAVKGQIPIRFPNFSVNKIRAEHATDVVEGVAKGEPEALIRATPKPRPTPDKRDVTDAQRLFSGFDPSKATAELNRQFPESLNAKQQVKLYYQAREAARARFKNPNSPANAGRVDAIAVRIYQATEKLMEDAGFVPRIGTGENVRLSDVINELGDPRRVQGILNEFGTELKKGSETWQAVQSLRARGAIGDAPAVKLAADKVSESAVATRSSNLLSDAQQSQVEGVLAKIAGASARTAGASPAAVTAATSLAKDAINAGKSAATIAVEQKSKVIDEIIAGGAKSGKLRPKVNESLTRGLESDLGKIPRWAQNDNKAVEFMMGRVATWWGQRELRPLSLNAIGSASATAQARGKALDKLFAKFDANQRFEAFRLAQGVGVPSSDATYQLATQIRRLMENMAGQVSGQSVLTRSAISMQHINSWMTRYKVGFQFTNKTVKDELGRVLDYSKGTDWLKSWESFTPKEDPKIFLFKMQQAMEQATREKALFDEIGERFGQKAPGGQFRNKIEHEYLQGYFFSDDIAKQIPRVIKDWTAGPWSTNSKVLRLYDRVLSMWKAGVTIYRPGHHIRNMIGDVYLGFMDNVTSVRPYVLAARVQRLLKESYSDLNDVDELVKLGVMGRQFGTPMPGSVLFKNKSGVEFTADQIAAVAHQKGLLEHARTLEDIIDLGEGSRFKPFGGRVQAAARGASELQSHNARLAHFIDKVMKSKGSDLERIFEDASRRARKWHPTGLDLTDFERKVMRRIIPFYSWIRKSTPLLIEGLVMNPGKTVIPAKVWDALQTMGGIEQTNGRADPFPVDQMFPEWIRSYGLGPISTDDGFLGKFSDQMPPGYAMGGMGINPLTDLMSQAQSPGKSIVTSLTPALGVPIELSQGRKSFTGEPIYGDEARPGAFGQYVGENIPIWSSIQGLTGITPFGDETRKASRSDEAGKEALVNWLSGLGIRGTGPYIRQARFEDRAPFLVASKERKEGFLQYLREQGGM